MRRSLVWGALLACAIGLLGFALVWGLSIVTGEVDRSAAFSGWQVTATRWGMFGLGVALGLFCSVAALRRRPAEGETWLFALPGVLLGGLVLAPLLYGAGTASRLSEELTDEYHERLAEHEISLAELERHPGIVRSTAEPATADVAGALLTPADLGRNWWPVREPLATARRSEASIDGGSVMITHAERVRTDQMWSIGPIVAEYLDRFASPALAEAALLRSSAERTRTVRLRGVTVHRGLVAGLQGVPPADCAWFRIGRSVWTVRVGGSELAVSPSADRIVDLAVQKALSAS